MEALPLHVPSSSGHKQLETSLSGMAERRSDLSVRGTGATGCGRFVRRRQKLRRCQEMASVQGYGQVKAAEEAAATDSRSLARLANEPRVAA